MKNSCMHAAIRELGTLFNEGAVGMLSDGQLLDRFVERRDASAFEAIVERYGPLVWGVCRRVLRDHHDAEDAFQATFLVLARKAASVMPREKLGNWLYGVAFQTAMKARATRAKRRVRERPAWEMTEPEAVPDEHADELLSRLDREVARLPEKYRMPIILCELEGKTHRQAAEQLGWPVGTVSGRLSRARALLASRLSRPGTPLTVGALGVLLAHDVARAGLPPELVRSTAQAASLIDGGKGGGGGGGLRRSRCPDRGGVEDHVDQQAHAHHGDAPGGLGSRGRRDEPHLPGTRHGTRESEERLRESQERSNPAEAAKEDMPPPKDQPKFAEAAKEDIPKDPNRLTGVETKSSSPPAENQQGVLQPTHFYWGYSFTASPTGNVAFAYNPETREVKAVRLNATQGRPDQGDAERWCRARGSWGCNSRGRRSPGSPSSTSNRTSGRHWTWTNRPTESSSRSPWVATRWRTKSVDFYICTVRIIHVGSSGPPGDYEGRPDPGDAEVVPCGEDVGRAKADAGTVQDAVPRSSWGCSSRGRRSPGSPSSTSSRASGRPGPGRTGQRSRPADGPGPRRGGVPSRSIFIRV